MGVVTGGTGNTVPGDQGDGHAQLLFVLFEIPEHAQRGFHKHVPVENCRAHHGVATPAEEGDVSPEHYVFCPVHPGVRHFGMAYQAHGFVMHLPDAAVTFEHKVRIDIGVFVFMVTFEANAPPVGIRPSPQHELASHMVFGMTGQASYPALVKGEGEIGSVGRNEICRVVVFPVIVAAETG
jgi:hypothetical protein